MSYGIRLQWENQRSETAVNIAAANPNYVQLGEIFEHPIRQLIISNLTDATLQFAIYRSDAIVASVPDHFPLAANVTFVNDVASNRVNLYPFFAGQGDAVYVKQLGVPTTGSVYVSAAYAKGD